MVREETICTCDICGAEMRESETGHKRWPAYLVLGYNMDEVNTKRYDDVCPECITAISTTIDRRKKGKKNGDAFSEFGNKR